MGARLFTAHDVERAARLAAQCAVTQAVGASNVEDAVAEAVWKVTDNSPLYYSESEVRSMVQYLLTKEDVEAELADALQAIGRA